MDVVAGLDRSTKATGNVMLEDRRVTGITFQPDGSYGGQPNGIIITTPEGKRIYIAGDTALFSDMQLIGEQGVDMAVLPIGGFFTMGPEEALRAVKFIGPKAVFPVHYNTFDVIQVDVAGWAQRVSNETEAQPIVLDPGGTYAL